MKWNVGTKIGTGFGIALAIFVIVDAVAYRNVTQQSDAAAWVTHTHEVQSELNQLLMNLGDAEASQRSYLITGDETYLPGYTAAAAAAEANRKQTGRLVADNPRQLSRVDALGPLLAQKVADLQAAIELRKSRDFAAAQAAIQSGNGRRSNDAVRNLAQEMNAEEDQLLSSRIEIATRDARDVQITIVVGTLLALALAII